MPISFGGKYYESYLELTLNSIKAGEGEPMYAEGETIPPDEEGVDPKRWGIEDVEGDDGLDQQSADFLADSLKSRKPAQEVSMKEIQPLRPQPAPELVTPSGDRKRTGAFKLPYFGKDLRILQNPSPGQIKGFLGRTKYKAARRLIDQKTGDVFIWDADAPALHELVAKELGVDIKEGSGDIIGIDD